MQIFRLMQDFCNKIRGAHIAKRIFIYAKEGAASPSHLSVATPTSLTKLVLVLFFFFFCSVFCIWRALFILFRFPLPGITLYCISLDLHILFNILYIV